MDLCENCNLVAVRISPLRKHFKGHAVCSTFALFRAVTTHHLWSSSQPANETFKAQDTKTEPATHNQLPAQFISNLIACTSLHFFFNVFVFQLISRSNHAVKQPNHSIGAGRQAKTENKDWRRGKYLRHATSFGLLAAETCTAATTTGWQCYRNGKITFFFFFYYAVVVGASHKVHWNLAEAIFISFFYLFASWQAGRQAGRRAGKQTYKQTNHRAAHCEHEIWKAKAESSHLTLHLASIQLLFVRCHIAIVNDTVLPRCCCCCCCSPFVWFLCALSALMLLLLL